MTIQNRGQIKETCVCKKRIMNRNTEKHCYGITQIILLRKKDFSNTFRHLTPRGEIPNLIRLILASGGFGKEFWGYISVINIML